MTDGYLADGYFSIGGTNSPLTASLTNTLLQDADPSLYHMVSYYQGIIDLHIAPRWNACIAAAGLTELDGYVLNEVVPYDPFRTGLSQQNSWRFPLLALYPKHSNYSFRTVTWYEVERHFELIFCLPPLTSEQYEYLHPFLQLVEKVIVDRTLQGKDSNYNNGELVWKESGLEKISVVSSQLGNLPSEKSNIIFPTLVMQLDVLERRMPNTTGFEDLAGFDNTIYTTSDGYTSGDGYAITIQEINL